MTSVEPSVVARTSGRRLLLGGLGCAVAAVAAYAAQFAAQRLFTPWYLPIGTTLGALLVAGAFRKTRNVWRGFVLLVVLVLCGGSWALMFVTRLPPYTGPVTVGKSFPAFSAMRADGTLFDDSDLRGDTNNVLVFFRGRW